MKIKVFEVNPLGVNCYIISSSHQAAIIDPGMFFDKERQAIEQYIRDEELTPTHLILTHGHFDHAMSCQWCQQTYGLTPQLHPADAVLQQHCEQQIELFLHRHIPAPQPQTTPITHGSQIQIGSTQWTVLHTPGHTAGCICLYCHDEHLLLSGDTIFQGSVGRTDLDSGNQDQLIQSIHQHILTLPDQTDILPGHGPSTTIALEKRINPYL